MNLGWKLAAHLNGWAPAGLLDTYESERHPVGERVMMQSLAQTALMAPGPEVAALRTLMGELFTIPDVAKHMAALLAGNDVRYDVGDDHPLSGWIVPAPVPRRRPTGRRTAARRPPGPARPRRYRRGRRARVGRSGRRRQRDHRRPARRGAADPARRIRRLGGGHASGRPKKKACAPRCGAGSGPSRAGSGAGRPDWATWPPRNPVHRCAARKRSSTCYRRRASSTSSACPAPRSTPSTTPWSTAAQSWWCAATNKTRRSWPGRSVASPATRGWCW